MSDAHYDHVIIVRHPKQIKLAEVATADAVVVSYGHGTTWTVVKDRHGELGEMLTRDELRRKLAL